MFTILVHDTMEPTKRAYWAHGLFDSREAAIEPLKTLVRDLGTDPDDPALTADLLDNWAQEAVDHGFVHDLDTGFYVIEVNTKAPTC
jgi:hypothetical protein